MTKKEIFKKLKKEYLDNLSVAAYIKYRDTNYSVTEEGKAAREYRVREWEKDAHQMVQMMKLLELPQKWINEFNESMELLTWENCDGEIENGESIPCSAREMFLYEKVVKGLDRDKIFDDCGNFIKRKDSVLDILAEQKLAA